MCCVVTTAASAAVTAAADATTTPGVTHKAEEAAGGFQGLLKKVFGKPNQAAASSNEDLKESELLAMRTTVGPSLRCLRS